MYQGRFSNKSGKDHDFNLANKEQEAAMQQPVPHNLNNTAGNPSLPGREERTAASAQPFRKPPQRQAPSSGPAPSRPDGSLRRAADPQKAGSPRRQEPAARPRRPAGQDARVRRAPEGGRPEPNMQNRLPQNGFGVPRSTNRDDSFQFNPVFDSREPRLISPDQAQFPNSQRQEIVVRKPKKTGVIIGGILFYLAVIAVVVGVIFSTKSDLAQITSDLAVYEKVQPTHISDGIFKQYFASPDWAELYEQCGVELSGFDGLEQFTHYMEERMGGKQLTYRKLSQQGNEQITYGVYAGTDKLAGFTILNGSEDPAAPEWVLDQLQAFYELDESFLISHRLDQKVKVNGIPLENESFLEMQGKRVTEDFMKKSRALEFPGTCVGEISGLLAKPQVTVEDSNGNLLEVAYNEETRTFSVPESNRAVPAEVEELALEAVRTYCEFMIKKAYTRELSVYFAPNTDTYNMIRSADLVWIQKEQAHAFADEQVSDYVQFDEDTFGVRVSLTWQLTRPDGTIKESPVDQTLIFKREPSDKWRCIRMSGHELLESYRTVRVQFIQGGEVISSQMVNANDTSVVCPKLEVPEGKKMVGWATREVDKYGADYYQRVLAVTGPGSAEVPEGLLDGAVDLYPVYENVK